MWAKRYRLLDYAAWRLVKWYVRRRLHVRRRLPPPRTIAVSGLAACVGLTAAAVAIAKRAAG